MSQQIIIPFVPQSKITDKVIARVNAVLEVVESSIPTEVPPFGMKVVGIKSGTLNRYKYELRKLFGLKKYSSLSEISSHPQLHQAIEYVVVRKENGNKGKLLSAKKLGVIVPSTGEQISIEEYLKSLYPREGVNASACYRALKARCIKQQVVLDSSLERGEGCVVATLEDLPSEQTVTRFLRIWREQCVAVRRGRSRRHDWEANHQPFVTRDITEYEPGELWIGDHTELDFVVLNEKGKPDMRWLTAFIDIRTGLLVGYNLNWSPSSHTIAAAFRSGVLGSQLKAFTENGYEKVSIINMPSEILIDNGKDYRSKYTQRIFGKVDFDDSARLSVQRLTKLHYALPYHAWSKAQMERWFGTFQTMLKYLPGYKGSKYQLKPDTLKDDMKLGKVLTVDQFDAMVALAVNTYNNRIHRSLKHQSPLQCYLTNQTSQRAIDLRVLDFLLMKVEKKPIHKCQIRLFGQDYYSDQLLKFNDRHADVYYDPNDLGFVSLYIDGEFAAIAGNKDMIGKDERGWTKILRDRKHGEREMAIELKEYRQGISDHDARLMLLEGELLNMSPVSVQLLGKTVPTVTQITGLEQEAVRMDEERKEHEQMVEIKKRARKRAVGAEYTLDNVINNIK